MPHHIYRRSGQTSSTDVRRVPSDLTMASKHRKTSSKDIRKLGKGPRERERQIYDDEWNSNEHESFPQFCMTCEKQFFDANERQLYCSAKCQQSDENSSGAHMPMDYGRSFRSQSYMPAVNHNRDIIPRASPSRPTSTYFSTSPPISPQADDYQHQHSSALSALKSLSLHPPSPHSPNESSNGFWPFGSRSNVTSPSTSLHRGTHSGFLSSTYDTGAIAGQYNSYNYYNTSASVGGAERPLPPRHGYRPKSIELVTPMLSR
ncbi:hypothetical protein CFIMG_003452RAa [Ceratocystis fimbriata CBS 114723]|uniref:Life-span regulatory factor domain-containing protein n=2 Tax=Ceratocystis TaxID=5157 RepID=A0A2C5XM74_9PEZI|nr:hypothetical protein CFIMG_003452RAa [Ceratocystis fimbriata CBS 114723]